MFEKVLCLAKKKKTAEKTKFNILSNVDEESRKAKLRR